MNDALALLREVANSGVAFDDERIGYVEVQIDRATWDAVRQFAASPYDPDQDSLDRARAAVGRMRNITP